MAQALCQADIDMHNADGSKIGERQQAQTLTGTLTRVHIISFTRAIQGNRMDGSATPKSKFK